MIMAYEENLTEAEKATKLDNTHIRKDGSGNYHVHLILGHQAFEIKLESPTDPDHAKFIQAMVAKAITNLKQVTEADGEE